MQPALQYIGHVHPWQVCTVLGGYIVLCGHDKQNCPDFWSRLELQKQHSKSYVKISSNHLFMLYSTTVTLAYSYADHQGSLLCEMLTRSALYTHYPFILSSYTVAYTLGD